MDAGDVAATRCRSDERVHVFALGRRIPARSIHSVLLDKVHSGRKVNIIRRPDPGVLDQLEAT